MSKARYIAPPVYGVLRGDGHDARTASRATPRSSQAHSVKKGSRSWCGWSFRIAPGTPSRCCDRAHPTVEDLVLETFSWEYHETIMAGYGKAAEAALKRVVREEKGQISRRRGRRDSHSGRWRLLHHRRTNGSGYCARSLHQRRGQHCGGRLRLGRRPGSLESQSNRRAWVCRKRCPASMS